MSGCAPPLPIITTDNVTLSSSAISHPTSAPTGNSQIVVGPALKAYYSGGTATGEQLAAPDPFLVKCYGATRYVLSVDFLLNARQFSTIDGTAAQLKAFATITLVNPRTTTVVATQEIVFYLPAAEADDDDTLYGAAAVHLDTLLPYGTYELTCALSFNATQSYVLVDNARATYTLTRQSELL